jgi:DNA-binding XRE family transcriptional regulator
MKITGAQVEKARGLLRWPRMQLAREAGVTVTAIGEFENGKKQPAMIVVSTIDRILRTAGIEFDADGEPRLRQNSEA